MPLLTSQAIQAMPEPALNETLHQLLVRPGLTLLSRAEELPYCFDLFHDIKMWYEIDNILTGTPHCSGLGAVELRQFAEEMGYLLDHPSVSCYTQDWSAAGKVLAELYTKFRFALETVDVGTYRASCVDARGYFHSFQDNTPLLAAIRCAVAAYQPVPDVLRTE